MYTITTKQMFTAVQFTAQHGLWIVAVNGSTLTVRGTASNMARFIAHFAGYDYSMTIK